MEKVREAKRDPRSGRKLSPAVWVCCQTHFECEGFTNTCPDCGNDYNWSGQLLAPREQWGEETGEHPSDIARIK